MQVIVFLIIVYIVVYGVSAILYRRTDYYRVTHKTYFQVSFDKGNWGEYKTYRNLCSFEKDGAKFLYNCYLPKDEGETTEIDVMMIHKSGIYVFESKNYSGWIFGDEKARTWTQTLPNGKKLRREHFLNPIMQNKLHIKWLKSQIGENVPIYSVIVFSDRCTLKKVTITSPEVKVIKREDAMYTVREMAKDSNNSVTEAEISDIYEKLYPFTQISERNKQKHIENIEKNHKDNTHDSDLSGNSELICPRCGNALVIRKAKRGENAGKEFYGCSSYPKCRYTDYIQELEK